MKLVHNWRRVVLISISFWAQVFGILSLIIPEIIFVFTGVDFDPALLWWAGILLLVLGLLGRLLRQTDNMVIEWFRIFGSLVVLLALSVLLASKVWADDGSLNFSVPLIAKWEGLRTEAYLDIVGVPTICYGATRGVKLGMVKTVDECNEMLRHEVSEYRAGWLNYVDRCAKSFGLTPKREAAYTSLAYNVGISGAGKSTATRRLNDGNIKGGCHAIGWWNKAGGRVVRGIVNRRSEETALCLEGL